MKRTPFRIPKKRRATLEGVEGRKTHRWKPGTAAIREIKKMQARTDLLIPLVSFCRVVRSIAEEYREGIRFTAKALEALHEGTEAYVVEIFTEANKLTVLEKMETIMMRHMRAVLEIKA